MRDFADAARLRWKNGIESVENCRTRARQSTSPSRGQCACRLGMISRRENGSDAHRLCTLVI